LQEARESAEQQALCREFVFTGDSGSIAPARDAIVEFVHPYCTDEQQEIDILIALQEGLANAILHGCRDDAGKLVHCAVEITPAAIDVVIQDPGDGFDTVSAADEAEDGSNLTQHGRGIYLMRNLMDEVSYRCNGSELHMRKLRTPVS